MKTIVYLVRHAEAEGNVYRRCHGQYDSLLTPRAYKQLPYLAARFIDLPIAAVYASDLFRARTTGKAVADKKGLSVQTEAAFREVNMGDWEDLTMTEVAMAQPDAFLLWATKPWQATPPNGENIIEAGERMFARVRELVQKHGDEQIVVATHGAAIRGAMRIAKGLKPDEIGQVGWCDNTSVSKIEFDENGKIEVLYYNDISHLPDELSTFGALQMDEKAAVPSSPEIYFRSVDLDNRAEAQKAIDYMRELHKNAYGTDENIEEQALLSDMKRAQGISDRAVCFGVLPKEEEPLALVYLNPANDINPAVGMVGGLCIDKAYRGKGISEQILGQAISVYRAMGKEYLGAYVAKENERAKGFYAKFAFENAGEHQNKNGIHYLMRKRIKVD